MRLAAALQGLLAVRVVVPLLTTLLIACSGPNEPPSEADLLPVGEGRPPRLKAELPSPPEPPTDRAPRYRPGGVPAEDKRPPEPIFRKQG